MNRFAQQMADHSNTCLTENGGINFDLDSFDNPLVKSFYTMSAFRLNNENKYSPVRYFDEAVKNDQLREWCGRYALMVRDITDGAGERSLGRLLIAKCLDEQILTTDQVIDFVINQRGGRFDDLIIINKIVTNGFVSDKIVQFIRDQFRSDLESYRKQQPISLLAKWLPSINTSSSQTRELGRQWAKTFKLSLVSYRKILSKLRKYLDVVERKITSNQFDQIDYKTVPALAMTRYSNVFRDHDYDRFDAYLQQVAQGKSKINTTGTTAPEIIHLTVADYETGRLMWENRKKYTFTHNVIPVCDVSGSMNIRVGKLTAKDVSIGLSLYLAEANQGPFHNKVISFSTDSTIVDLTDYKTLSGKIHAIEKYGGLTTNIENALRNVLDLAIDSHCSQDEIPTLVFFTDMEFDPAQLNDSFSNFAINRGSSYKTIFEVWRNRYQRAGYDFPKLVFWNIASRSNSVPVKTNPNGLVLVSGYNENLMKMVVTDQYDPWNALKQLLINPRYAIE